MLTIWSVPDCFELFKTNVDKRWCGHSGVQTQQQPDSNGNSVACTEHNLGDRGFIVNSGTGTGPTGFIWVSYVTGPVYIPDHPCPSWLYECHRNTNGKPQYDWGMATALTIPTIHQRGLERHLSSLAGLVLVGNCVHTGQCMTIPSHPWLYCWHKRNSMQWRC